MPARCSTATVPPPGYATGSWRRGSAQSHQRSIAVGLANFDSQQLIPRSVDLHLLDGAHQLTIQGNQSEAPAPHVACEVHVENLLESAPIARQRGADALDEWLNLRVAVQIQHTAAAAALHGQYAAGEHQIFWAGQQSTLLQPVRSVVAQLAGGFDRVIENGQKLLLDELDAPVPAHGEQAHDRVKIAH